MKNSVMPKLRFKEFSGAWEKRTIKEATNNHNNQRKPLKDSERSALDKIYPYYGASGIIDYVDDYLFDGEYILLGEDGANILSRNSRLVFIAKGKFWVNNHAHIFSAKENFNLVFLSERLENINYSIYNTGTVQPKLNSAIVSGIEFYAPTLAEQEKIAAYLSAIDKKISLLKEKENELQLYKKGIMQKIFSQSLRFKDEEDKEFEDWEETMIGNICTIKRGASPRPITDPKWFNDNSSIGWVRISDVTKSNTVLTKTEQFLSVEGIAKSRLVKKGNLIMSICATIGKPIYTGFDVCIHDGFVVFDELKCNHQYLFYYLSHIQNNWYRYGQPGTQVNLNSTIVSEEYFPLPSSITEQEKIANFLSAIDEKIEKVKRQLEEMQAFKKGMLQQLFV